MILVWDGVLVFYTIFRDWTGLTNGDLNGKFYRSEKELHFVIDFENQMNYEPAHDKDFRSEH
jgi:hypothetical protein